MTAADSLPDEGPEPCFEAIGLSVSYGTRGEAPILDALDLTIDRGSFVAIVGTSGSGKTTLLRALAGLVPAYGGVLRRDGEAITRPRHDAVVVFQDYENALFPWRTVRRNVAFPLEVAGMSRAKRDRRVDEAIEMVGLTRAADRYPAQLSGGMQQRVQIARAVVLRPSVLLMDEPFGALDAMTKASLQDDLRALREQTGATVLFVTHDIDEAVYLSDRILVLSGRPGRIEDDVNVDLGDVRDQVRTREGSDFLAIRRRVLGAVLKLEASNVRENA